MSNIRILLGILPMALASAAWSQLTQAQMKNFPTKPPKPFVSTRTFTAAGQGFYQSNNPPVPTKNIYDEDRDYNYSDLDYFRFAGIRGKRIQMWVDYAGSRPTSGGNCAHTHLSYGLKGKYKVKFLFSSYSGWVWLGGGTKSGNWDDQTKTCNRSVVNSLSATDPNLGWGTDYVTLPTIALAAAPGFQDVGKAIDTVIMAGMAPTHGSGDCEAEQSPLTGIKFKMCLDQFWSEAYSY